MQTNPTTQHDFVPQILELAAQPKPRYSDQKRKVLVRAPHGLLIEQNRLKAGSGYAKWAQAHPNHLLVWFIPHEGGIWKLWIVHPDKRVEELDPPSSLFRKEIPA